MRKKYERAKTIFITMLLILCMTATAFADDLSDNQEEQEQVKSEMAQLEEETIAQKAVVDELAGKVAELQAQITELENQIATKEADIREIKLAISDREEGLGQRLRVMYRNGSIGFLDVILKSKDISEFLSNISMVQEIYRNDANILDELEEQHKRLASEEAELREAKRILESNKAELDAQKAAADAEAAKLKSQMDALQSKLDELEAEEADLKKRLAALSGSGYTGQNYYSGGVLAWPCTSYVITSPFEPARLHPILGYVRAHNGLDLGCGYGTPIFAAESGVVIESTYSGGSGYYIVIQHSSSMTTMYAHNSQLLVSVGQTVSRGEVIARCGSTGWSTGPHCHFEVRINGTPVDPLGYL